MPDGEVPDGEVPDGAAPDGEVAPFGMLAAGPDDGGGGEAVTWGA
ncbi:MAG: hypothetical protein R6U94_12970 [Nitriliruptoraceae bacterium]